MIKLSLVIALQLFGLGAAVFIRVRAVIQAILLTRLGFIVRVVSSILVFTFTRAPGYRESRIWWESKSLASCVLSPYIHGERCTLKPLFGPQSASMYVRYGQWYCMSDKP